MAMGRRGVEFQRDGAKKVVPIGWSWTTLIFGPFPAFFRGDWRWGLIISVTIVLCRTLGLALPRALATLGDPFGSPGYVGYEASALSELIGMVPLLAAALTFAAIYNKRYENGLRKRGWKESE